MKKLVVTVVSLLCLTSAAFAVDRGMGLRLGAAQNDPATGESWHKAYTPALDDTSLTKRKGVVGLEAFEEWTLSNETIKFGVKLGADFYFQNELKGYKETPLFSAKLTETTYAFPLTLYYKKDNDIKNWSCFIGAGATLIRTEVKLKGEDSTYVYEGSESKIKLFPHITAGAEYRFDEHWALGLDVKYNIAAKVKKDGEVLSDRSGIGGAVTARFYF